MKRAASGIRGSAIRGRAAHGRARKLVGALSLALLVFCGSAQAATFAVNNPGDAGDATLNGMCLTAGGVCTLRAAIQESNFNAPTADTIGFTAAAQPTINLNSALPNIVGALTISGPGAGALTVRRNTAAAYRIFTITGDVDVVISGLTIRNGLSDATTTPAASGGAIAFAGTAAGTGSLSLSAVTVTANTATAATGEARGGGVSVVFGDLTITNSTISNNAASATGTAASAGGGVYVRHVGSPSTPTTTLTSVTIAGNAATASGGGTGALGGGIAQLAGSIAIAGGAISDNTAAVTGAAVGGVFGGGADLRPAETATLTNVSVAGNEATVGGAQSGSVFGGGIDLIGGESLVVSGGAISDNTASVTGASSTAAADGGGAAIAGDADVTVTNVSVAGNAARAGGGDFGSATGGGICVPAAESFEMSGGAISDNTAAVTGASVGGVFGGGADLRPAETATVTDVSVAGNEATVGGAQSGSVFGGGIDFIGGASLVMSGDAISDNTASVTGASSTAQADGGGVAIAGDENVTLTNSTVSGNTATSSGGVEPAERGGGIQLANGTLTLTSVTLAFNEAATGANLIAREATSIGARNTIVSDPVGGANCAEVDSGDIVSDGFNLSSDASCGFAAGGDQQGVDPDLAPLANNGGPTFTHALPNTSLAVDKGSSGASGAHPAVTTDQRGMARPVDLPTLNAIGGNGADIGAFERQAADYLSTVLAGGPRGYWRFGEPSGSALLDSSPNNNHGTYLGGVVLGAAGIAGAAPNTAATYDGVNDTGRVPDANSLDVGNSFTLEGWIKRSSDTKTHELFNKGANGFQLVVMNSASANRVLLRRAGVTAIAQSTAPVPADGANHHVVATMNGPGTAKIYVDGALASTSLSPVQQIQDTAFPLTFGSAGSTPAQYDEFALYDQVLTLAEVQAHYQAGIS
jgi:hypothetical protein